MSDVKTYVAGHKSPDTDSICVNKFAKEIAEQIESVSGLL